ncbi:hypothetical protein [Hydrocoleum sp. CS-953]|uniref:hypothetical protein n=1 Tax=Hydrocoleum sp. CS-953 TaxID=1671698 RepID=UPI00117B63F7|nr:hypothetical protein [Hydrocoleum sp. CS-953]
MTDGEQRPLKTFFTEILRAEGIEPGNRHVPRGLALLISLHCGIPMEAFGVKSTTTSRNYI